MSTPSPPTTKKPLARCSERLRGKPSPSYAPPPKKKRKVMAMDENDENKGDVSNVAVRPPNSDNDEEEDDYALSMEEKDYAEKQQEELQEYVAIIKEKASKSPTHAKFEKLHSEVMKVTKARNWPRLVEIVEGLPHARQKEEYCKNSYEALKGKTLESIRGEGEFEALCNADDAVHEITEYVATTCVKVMNVSMALLYLSGRSQADSTSRGTTALASGDPSACDRSLNNTEWSQNRKELPPLMEADQLRDTVATKTLEQFGDNRENFGDKRIGVLSDLEKSHQVALREFNALFQSLIAGAEVFNDKHDKGDFMCALGRFENALYSCVKKKKAKKGNLLVPGPVAAEVDYAQPFLLVLLQALGSAVDKTLISGSPAKTNVQTNRICPETSRRPKRIADKSISANGRFIFMLGDDSVEIPVEEKRGQRSKSNPSVLLVECTDQILSHLAKMVGIGFNFANVGVDTKATGVVLTAAYVNIIQLRLDKAGTRDIELTICETGCLPLLSEANFDRWTGSYAENWSGLRTRLYPSKNKPSVPTGRRSVPTGLVALWNLMTSSRKDLFGPPPCKSSCLQDLIGFGAYASVYSGKGEFNDCVIKLSRYGVTTSLEREARVLQALNPLQDSSFDFIPRIVKSTLPGLKRKNSLLKELNVEIGGVTTTLPALILEPRAITVPHFIANIKRMKDKKDALRAISNDAFHALAFIHEKGFCHNDVSPKNILVNITGKQHKNATGMLVDFGLASRTSEDMIGFHGTPCYVHRAVFRMYPRKHWNPQPDYDKSSLAFSMAALAMWTVPSSEMNTLWKSFQPSEVSGDTTNSLDIWATNRSSTAWSYLQEAGFPEKDREAPEKDWKKWCFDS